MSVRKFPFFSARALCLRLTPIAVLSCATDVAPTVVASSGSSAIGGSAGPSGGSSTSGAPNASGGNPTSGGAPSGGAGATGGASAGATGVAGGLLCAPPAAAQTCAGTVPKKQTLLAFATYSSADGAWGEASQGDLTGGTSKFQGEGVAPLTLAVEGRDATATLRVTGSIPTASYAGFVFWFGPCVNAATITNEAEIGPSNPITTSATSGISFGLGGTLGGSQLKVQVQTHADYPADAGNAKGGCVYSSCATRWTDCAAPTHVFTTIPAALSETPFPWASFVEGNPKPTTNGDGIVGLQFQFECVTQDACAVDVRLATIRFTR